MEELALQALRIQLEFDMDYIFELRDAEKLPSDVFLAWLAEHHSEAEVTRSGLTSNTFLVRGELTAIDWAAEIARVLSESGFDAQKAVVTISTPEDMVQEAAADDEDDESDDMDEMDEIDRILSELEEDEELELDLELVEEVAEADSPLARLLGTQGTQTLSELMAGKPATAPGDGSAKQRIDALVGAQALKDLAEELSLVAPHIHKAGTGEAFAAQNYLISIGDGCGLTTALELLVQHISELGLFKFNRSRRVNEIDARRTPEEIMVAVDDPDEQLLHCFDISGWLDRLHTREFRAHLKWLDSIRQNSLYAFRIPFLDEATQKQVMEVLSDIFFVREVPIAPLSMEELRGYAGDLFEQRRVSMEEESWEVFENKIIDEKSDGSFFGLRTVKKVVNEIIYQKHRQDAMAGLEAVEALSIKADDIRDLVNPEAVEQAMPKLDSLVGIEPIKERILTILTQIEMAMQHEDLEKPSIHMRFVGAPGTGKTTVARILGQLAKERKILSKGLFFEYSGRDFCGQYIGETAPKTAAMCRDAYGSVLFIDEAYSLFRGRDSNDYGREAIDTLIAQMENHRQDFMVIMAGYEGDMDTLMHANAGLASRMPYTIHFPNYSREQLFEIFMSMTKQSFEYDEGFEQAARDYFNSLSKEVLEDESFANARFVRNLFERTWGKAATRRQMEPNAPFLLMACDFDKAIAEREFAELQQRKDRRIGFEF